VDLVCEERRMGIVAGLREAEKGLESAKFGFADRGTKGLNLNLRQACIINTEYQIWEQK
jgi:hypothetical protein